MFAPQLPPPPPLRKLLLKQKLWIRIKNAILKLILPKKLHFKWTTKNFNKVAFPMMQNIWPNLITKDVVATQPMTKKSDKSYFKLVIDKTIYFDRYLKLKEKTFGNTSYRCAKISRIYPHREFYLNLELYNTIQKKLQETNGTLYWYDDMGILCGTKGYMIVKDNQILNQFIIAIG